MTPETLTQKLHDLSDRKLREEISKALEWFQTAMPFSESIDHSLLSSAMSITSLGHELKRPVYSGDAIRLLKVVAFIRLRDSRRDAEVRSFMEKVNGMATQFENLGLVIADNAEGENNG